MGLGLVARAGGCCCDERGWIRISAPRYRGPLARGCWRLTLGFMGGGQTGLPGTVVACTARLANGIVGNARHDFIVSNADAFPTTSWAIVASVAATMLSEICLRRVATMTCHQRDCSWPGPFRPHRW